MEGIILSNSKFALFYSLYLVVHIHTPNLRSRSNLFIQEREQGYFEGNSEQAWGLAQGQGGENMQAELALVPSSGMRSK